MRLSQIVFSVFLLDQVTKYAVVSSMHLNESIPIVKHIFHLTYILNPGAAFGMMEHSRLFFITMACVVLAAFYVWRRVILREPLWGQYGIALFAGGALGNMLDRIRQGEVIDFLDFRVWPIFNVADIAICVGVGLVIWTMLQTEKKRRKSI